MNMFSSYLLVPDAAYFPTLRVAGEFYIQGTTVYFSLITPKAQSYVSAVIEANEVVDSLAWNNTSDPQNDEDVDFEKLKIELYHVAKVEDFDDVLAVQAQPFLLTQEQAQSLNEMLTAHFEELKVNELKGMVA